MRVVRGILYGVLGLIVVVGLGIAAVFYFTGGAVGAADEFLATVAEKGAAAAYQQASPAFRAAQNEAGFVAWARQHSLDGYKSANWTNRSLSGGHAELKGTLTLRSGAAVPATIALTKNAAGSWQVVSMEMPPLGVTSGGKPPLPETTALAALATATMAGLGEAITKDDFADFYAQTSALWQAQTSAEQIRAAYAQFITRKIDLAPAASATPVFSAPPAIGDDGALELRGYFPAKPQLWYFKFRYVYEHPEWKLVGVAVSTDPR